MSPLSNSYIAFDRAREMAPLVPLHAWVCDQCWLVQLEAFETPEKIFGDDAYFGSCSDGWLQHARTYSDAARARFGLGGDSRVIEVASNDGYLLQYFRDAGVPVLGIEPAANVAKVATDRGSPTRVAFFGEALGRQLAEGGLAADLVAGNNVFAHVPDISDVSAGFGHALKPEGVLTLELLHLLELICGVQFDTIYQEHFSYLSLLSARRVLERAGLRVFDVERSAVAALIEQELQADLERIETYFAFSETAKATKRHLLEFLIEAKRAGKRICGYGAPAKGNTLLKYCGVREDFIDFTVDRNLAKQNTLLPGTRIPVCAPEAIAEAKPDLVLILPWNLKDETVEQMEHIREWGGRFVIPVPRPVAL